MAAGLVPDVAVMRALREDEPFRNVLAFTAAARDRTAWRLIQPKWHVGGTDQLSAIKRGRSHLADLGLVETGPPESGTRHRLGKVLTRTSLTRENVRLPCSEAILV